MQKQILIVLLTLITHNIMAQKEIKTSIQIEASPETIWQVLTNFKAYPDWNPFITFAEGDFKEGEKVKITAGGMDFKPEILTYSESKELKWLGKFLFRGLFDGEHSFEIIDNGDGTCTFIQEEKFRGLLVGLFAKKLDTKTKSGFEEMNLKLKQRCENWKSTNTASI